MGMRFKMMILKNDWLTLLKNEFEQPYFLNLQKFLIEEYASEKVHPDREDIFSALNLTSYKQTKVVIIGQDPYHGWGQAHGLSFSVKPGMKLPPSLKNIFKELQDDIGTKMPNNGYLVKWAQQGVLMLNTVLTVRDNIPNSHKGKGWETFTDQVITILNRKETPLVFILWGKHAQEKLHLITSTKHLVIQSAHPSPFSARRGFFGSKPFSKTNYFLKQTGNSEIDWQIEE